MSHRFKQQIARYKDEKNEREIAAMARRIRDQQDLEKLLDGADDQMRASLIERLLPYLDFEIFAVDPTPDCPHCGMKRGSLIPHACVS